MLRRLSLAAILALASAPAASEPISLQDSFRLGSGSGILCTAQAATLDRALSDMFDRGYSIVCRDAAVPVGQLYALKLRGDDPAGRLEGLRAGKAECGEGGRTAIAELGAVEVIDCRLSGGDVPYRAYLRRVGGTLYVAEGLAGYDSALRLGLRTLIANRPVEGEVAIATTEAGDAAAFARAQAGSLDPGRALAEAYRRNNSGSYAESAEFFGALLGRSAGAGRVEALLNDALQQSNLGRYAQAAKLFDQSEPLAADPVNARLLRNYRAIHLMNQDQQAAALEILDRPLPTHALLRVADRPVIDAATAARLNAEAAGPGPLRGEAAPLLPEERAQILDGQAQHLRGTLHRLRRRPEAAEAALRSALAEFTAVRGGRVVSTMWMRAQIQSEMATIAEARGDRAEAERQHQAAIVLLQTHYPESPALLSAQGRLAASYARAGQVEPARALYRQIVEVNARNGQPTPALHRTLAPYFELLDEDSARPESVAEMFEASQLLVRPGVAQTQAVLARELSGGSDEAARLFRQSVNLTRDIERRRVEIARLAAASPQPSGEGQPRLAALQGELAAIEQRRQLPGGGTGGL